MQYEILICYHENMCAYFFYYLVEHFYEDIHTKMESIIMKTQKLTLCLLLVALGFSGINAAPRKTTKSETAAKKQREVIENNVLEVAKNNKNLSKFVELVELTGLDKTLQTSKKLTLFAPTNKAFAQLEAENPGLFDNLNVAANRKHMARILKYHMLSSTKLSDNLKEDNSLATKLTEGNGSRARKKLMVHKKGTEIALRGDKGSATIVKTNLTGGNGVIQEIDAVLMPDAEQKRSTKIE